MTQQKDFNGLIYKNQYIELSTSLRENPALFGLGESTKTDGFMLDTNSHVYTLFNRDTPCSVGNQNLYGSHPFYLEMVQGKAHGVVMMNSNGMDIVTRPQSLTYRMNGGIIDLYVFTGSSPEQVVQQYTELIGRPYFVPYWSLGFHQSKYGYKSVYELEAVVANYSSANIPLETMWSDIDYMNAFKDFTLDPVNYPQHEMDQFVGALHQNNQHYVVIEDPGINVDPGYAPYDQLLQDNLYIRAADGSPFQGCVWPGATIFPDFLNNATTPYWQNQIESFLQLVDVDGLWIDMNEISNAFCNGACPASQCHPPNSGGENLFLQESSSQVRLVNTDPSFNPTNPPYKINNGGDYDPLYVKTLNMDATHVDGYYEYDVHNLYGLTEAIATHKALQTLKKGEQGQNIRPFILSRSTFMGSGKWTAHWSGDNASQWPDVWYSVLNMLNMNLFGIPMIGSDICGFNGNSNEELCARWILVGAFSPFCRDHSSINTIPQELYVWPQVAANGRFILNVRYSLLPYYYTLMYHAHMQGSTVIRPLFFEWPSDTKALGVDQQFMVGPALIVTPVLSSGADNVRGYFPAGKFYSYFNYTDVIQSSTGQAVTLEAPISTIPLHIRAGYIIPTQTPAYTVAETRANPYTLLVALQSDNAQATGDLYIDDGLSQDAPQQDYTYIKYQCGSKKLTATISGKVHSFGSTQKLDTIKLIGVTSQPSAVIFNSVQLGSSQVQFDKSQKLLTITSLTQPMVKEFVLSWH